MSIFDSLLDDVPPAPPGDLLWLACDVSSLMGQLRHAEIGSPQYSDCIAEVLKHRAALARSMPATDLDLLMLAFTIRQALWLLRNAEQLQMDESRRRYWGAEADAAIIRMQCLLEKRCGTSTDELDLDFFGGSMKEER